MNEWTRAQEADFQELVHRAAEQSRECYRRRDVAVELPRREPGERTEPKNEPHPQPIKKEARTQSPRNEVQPQPHKNETRIQPTQRGGGPVRKNLPAPLVLPVEPPAPRHADSAPKSQQSTRPPTVKEKQGLSSTAREKGGAVNLKGLMEKLDNEGLMLAMLLWLLIAEKADNTVILAIAYILVV